MHGALHGRCILLRVSQLRVHRLRYLPAAAADLALAAAAPAAARAARAPAAAVAPSATDAPDHAGDGLRGRARWHRSHRLGRRRRRQDDMGGAVEGRQARRPVRAPRGCRARLRPAVEGQDRARLLLGRWWPRATRGHLLGARRARGRYENAEAASSARFPSPSLPVLFLFLSFSCFCSFPSSLPLVLPFPLVLSHTRAFSLLPSFLFAPRLPTWPPPLSHPAQPSSRRTSM